MNVMGIIFTNDATMGELTNKRTIASIPFGGRYRQVDFALSNLACAGVRHIGVIAPHHVPVGSESLWCRRTGTASQTGSHYRNVAYGNSSS